MSTPKIKTNAKIDTPPQSAKKAATRQGPIKAANSPEKPSPALSDPKEPRGKIGLLVGLLRRPQGATLADMTAATGWQPHSVRGALAAAVKKRLGLALRSAKQNGVRTYSLEAGA